jgi:ArsR family transcriptional regulator, arsenate/arsenite/antimonite-responsive transcriptional repressor
MLRARTHICQATCIVYNGGMAGTLKTFSLDVLFRALADPTRLRLLNLIADREICVGYFVEILGISQPKVSRHLAYLRKAGIVTSRREGKWMHYRLAMPKDKVAHGILRETLKHLREDSKMRRDISSLSSVCSAPKKYVLLQGAPQPGPILRVI